MFETVLPETVFGPFPNVPRIFLSLCAFLFPKGPFCTRNGTALDSVVFCYCRSFLQTVPFSCLFFLEKQALVSTLRIAFCYCCSVLSRRSEFALRAIFSTEGSFGFLITGRRNLRTGTKSPLIFLMGREKSPVRTISLIFPWKIIWTKGRGVNARN